ncbi:MAG: 30S ribosomal protein S3 [Candidatus Wildermuthbacteria bacterium]|nr:30S ribosomal protein S3 [Candidatus Wildermuthbacteria bacterium]MBI2647931.1 30S ribosomal protein S3 [Candidatus Wildermuthbacteria bacterium]
MSHKVHPTMFRILHAATWASRWFDPKKSVEFLREDFVIRDFVERSFLEASVEGVEIERFAGKTIVIINSARPGLIIGRQGAGIEDLKKRLLKEFRRRHLVLTNDLRVEVREVKNPWISAPLAGQWIAQQLVKRMPHRKVMKQTLSKIMANKEVGGAKIHLSGRLGGTEIARRETLRQGRLPLQTIRANVHYALTEAHTTAGVVGIKIWIFKNEKT